VDAPLIITTKIRIPQRREGLLRRSRLVDFIHASIERKLFLISAPAGYGKSSLLVDYASETDLPVCWYSLDAYDRDPRTFLAHLVASLRTRFPKVGERTLAILQASPQPTRQLRALVGTLVNELYESIADYFVIILDDYHTVEEQDEINEIIGYLLQLSDENCHLILSTRTLPSLPNLALLTARGQVAGLSADELRFTPEEVQMLVRKTYHLDLPLEQAKALCDHAEGWITGILLSAQSQWQKVLADVAGAHTVGINVYDYMAEQVLAAQPPDIQSFLLRSSVLEEVNPRLCEELLGPGDWEGVLDHLLRRNLFVTLLEGEGEGPWVRYHSLLREFLRNRLAREMPSVYFGLERRAADIYVARKEWERAATIYQRLGDAEELARLSERVGQQLYMAGRLTILSGWLESIPAQLFASRPHLLSLRANILADRGELPGALALYDHAETLFAAAGDVINQARVLMRKSAVLRFQGKYQEVIALCRKVLAMVEGREDAQPIVAEAHKTIGICQFRLGFPPAAHASLERALEIYRRLSDAHNIAVTHQEMGIVERARGRLDAAIAHYRSALEYWQRLGNPGPWAITLNNLGVVYHLRGDYEQAQQVFMDALTRARESGHQRVEATVLASLGDVQRDLGNYAEALESYRRGLDVAQRADEAFATTYILQAMGYTYLLQGQTEQAETYLRIALERAEASGSVYERGLSLTSWGVWQLEQGDSQGALATLEQACSLLAQGDLKQELAWARLQSALARFRAGEITHGLRDLGAALDIAEAIGSNAFLAAAGRRALPLLRYAARADARARRLLARMQVAAPERAAERAEVAAIPHRLEIHAFGQGQVLADGQLVSSARWATNKARELFFCLVGHPDGLRKEQIGLLFWPDHSPERLNGIFRSTMYRLRRAIFPEFIIFDEETGLYRFNRQLDYWYDVEEFERQLQRGDEGDNEARALAYEQAITLYNGDYLEDCYEDWAQEERERLQQRYLAALSWLGDFRLAQGFPAVALDHYRRILTVDPYREEIHRQMIRCYLQMGDRAAAARQYRECVRLLWEDLRVAPSRETQALYREMTG
jgi:LuxR family maltose regulon positive regulatory protein